MDPAQVTDVKVLVLDSLPGFQNIPTGQREHVSPTKKIRPTTARSSRPSDWRSTFWRDVAVWMRTWWYTPTRITPSSA